MKLRWQSQHASDCWRDSSPCWGSDLQGLDPSASPPVPLLLADAHRVMVHVLPKQVPRWKGVEASFKSDLCLDRHDDPQIHWVQHLCSGWWVRSEGWSCCWTGGRDGSGERVHWVLAQRSRCKPLPPDQGYKFRNKSVYLRGRNC